MSKFDQLVTKVADVESQPFYALETLVNDLGLSWAWFDHYPDTPALTLRPVKTWYCTDQWVGVYILYLDDQPVAFTYQSGRKSPCEIFWRSRKDRDQTSEYLQKFAQDNDGWSWTTATDMLVDRLCTRENIEI